MLEIVWKQGSEQDLLGIFRQLEESRGGAGDRFVLELDTTLEHLRRHPQMAPVFEHPMRRSVVGNTGFGLFDTAEARGLIVHALIHLRQDPSEIRIKVRRHLNLE